MSVCENVCMCACVRVVRSGPVARVDSLRIICASRLSLSPLLVHGPSAAACPPLTACPGTCLPQSGASLPAAAHHAHTLFAHPLHMHVCTHCATHLCAARTQHTPQIHTHACTRCSFRAALAPRQLLGLGGAHDTRAGYGRHALAGCLAVHQLRRDWQERGRRAARCVLHRPAGMILGVEMLGSSGGGGCHRPAVMLGERKESRI